MKKTTANLKGSNDKISLNWAQLNAIAGGLSAIDLSSLAIRNREDARDFVRTCGWDIDIPAERERIGRAHAEAIAFIDKNFLHEMEQHLVAPEVRNPTDVLDLLVYSSNYLNKSNAKQMWACAVLKVMHGIFHIDHDFKLKYFDQIRSQIFGRLDNLVVTMGSENFFTDGKIRLPLFLFEKKRNKDRESILLKLLQKPSYVASDIYDHLGIRLVFDTKFECLLALKVLTKSHLISAANLKPFRSRNNLLDMNHAKQIFSRFRPILERSKHYPREILRKMDEELDASFIKKGRQDNPHSSKDFQVIQITARQMVRIPNPLSPDEGFQFTPGSQGSFAFYFDYEIQVTDKNSYQKSLYGPSSHQAYKQRQQEAVRRRVLGSNLIKFLDEQKASGKIRKGA